MKRILLFLLAAVLPVATESARGGTVSCGRQTWTTDGTDDEEEIQAALDAAKNGGTITIGPGDYFISKRIHEAGKSLNIAGEGTATLHIDTPAGNGNGLCLEGTLLQTTTFSKDARKGGSDIVLSETARVRAGDLIKIWKDVAWSPLDYPDYKTGELYEIKKVRGNAVRLTEPLFRDYPTSGSHAMIYRPIEVHIKNIGVEGGGATTRHEAIALRACKNSSVEGCRVRNSGLCGVSFYTSFNGRVRGNRIADCILPGSGYGVGVWSGSAHFTIANNRIENCRHCVTGNSDERVSLVRDVTVSHNDLTGASIPGSHAIDAHPIAIDYVVTDNVVRVTGEFYAFSDGSVQSVFSGNKVYGGSGAVIRRGNVNGGSHEIRGNRIESKHGFTYRGYGSGASDTLLIENNTQTGGRHGVLFTSDQPETFTNIVIRNNKFTAIAYGGIDIGSMRNGCGLTIVENTFADIPGAAIHLNANSAKPAKLVLHGNSFKNVGAETRIEGIRAQGTAK